MSARGGGVARARDLAAVGLGPNELRVLVRRGTLVRLRHGSYADGARYHGSAPVERHRLAARAAASGLPTHAVSHLSALVLWDLPVLEADVGDVHLCAVDVGRARRAAGVRFHAPIPREQVRERGGTLVVQPALAVLQTAAVSGCAPG